MGHRHGRRHIRRGLRRSAAELDRCQSGSRWTRRAALYADRDGGGALGGCRQSVFIDLAEAPDPAREPPKTLPYEKAVFWCSCGTSVTMTWHDSRELEISYAVGGGVSTYQKSESEDGAVGLRCVALTK